MITNIPQHTLAINVGGILNRLGVCSAPMSTQEAEMQQKGNSALKLHKINHHILLLQLLSTCEFQFVCVL